MAAPAFPPPRRAPGQSNESWRRDLLNYRAYLEREIEGARANIWLTVLVLTMAAAAVVAAIVRLFS